MFPRIQMFVSYKLCLRPKLGHLDMIIKINKPEIFDSGFTLLSLGTKSELEIYSYMLLDMVQEHTPLKIKIFIE